MQELRNRDMRKLRPAEQEALVQFLKPHCEVMFSGRWPKGTNDRTLDNLYRLGLIRVSKRFWARLYPLELTEEGRQWLENRNENLRNHNDG